MDKCANQKKPIFIVGTPRSGTTLAAKILGHHSNVFMPGETHFFDDIFSNSTEFGSLKYSDSINKVSVRLFDLYGRYYEPDDQQRIEQAVLVAEAHPGKRVGGGG